MFVKILSKAEKEKYFNLCMKGYGYKPDLWLQSNMDYELWNENGYRIIKVYKRLYGNKRTLIYEAGHKIR